MSILIENVLNEVMYAGGINTNKNVTIGGSANFDASGSTGTFKTPTGTLTLGGNVSAAGTVSLDMSGSSGTFKFPTGAITFGGGTVSGFAAPVVQSALAGATVALTAAQSGSVCINRSTSGSPSWTLPAAAAGLEFTFITANTTAGFTITTGTAAVIHAKTNATGTAITSTATTGAITNTQATAVVGDCLQLVCDGTNWWPMAQSGIFAAS